MQTMNSLSLSSKQYLNIVRSYEEKLNSMSLSFLGYSKNISIAEDLINYYRLLLKFPNFTSFYVQYHRTQWLGKDIECCKEFQKSISFEIEKSKEKIESYDNELQQLEGNLFSLLYSSRKFSGLNKKIIDEKSFIESSEKTQGKIDTWIKIDEREKAISEAFVEEKKKESGFSEEQIDFLLSFSEEEQVRSLSFVTKEEQDKFLAMSTEEKISLLEKYKNLVFQYFVSASDERPKVRYYLEHYQGKYEQALLEEKLSKTKVKIK